MTDQIHEITEFLNRLEEQDQEIVPGSLEWVQHPLKPGREIIAVQVQPKQESEDDTKRRANVAGI